MGGDNTSQSMISWKDNLRLRPISFLLLVTAAAYAPVFLADFLNFDDDAYVTGNTALREGVTWAAVKWSFTAYHSSNWHPLTWLSHALDISIFGFAPWGHHATNLLLHLLNTALVYMVMFRLIPTSMAGRAPVVALIVALLFALHPLHVESVAWISERKDLLSGFFALMTTWAYAQYARRPRPGLYLAVLLLFTCGLMSKPMLVTWPCVLLLLDYWPLRRLQNVRAGLWCVAEKLPLFALSLASVVITLQAQTRAVVPLEARTVDERINNAAVSYMMYLWKAIFPYPLATPYPFLEDTLAPWRVALAWAILLSLSTVALVKWRRAPWFIVGWVWFLGTLVPVIGIVQVGEQAMADRYSYLPHLGLFLALACAVAQRRHSSDEQAPPSRYRWILIAFAAVLASLTFRQTLYWRNSETLFRHSIAVTEKNYVAHNNLGKALMENGRIDEALGHFEQSVAISPGNLPARNNLGVAYLLTGQPERALAQLELVRQNVPPDPDLLVNMGAAYLEMKNHAAARAVAEEALRLNPSHPKANALRQLLLK